MPSIIILTLIIPGWLLLQIWTIINKNNFTYSDKLEHKKTYGTLYTKFSNPYYYVI